MSDCELTPQARAFSTILTAFVGSIVNGISSGAIVAFMTGWISFFGVTRVLSGSVVSLYQGFFSDYTGLGDDKVTVLGWMGWLYTALYSPIVQILWLAENWTAASAPLKIVRALGISVSALSLTIDTKKRYASTLSDTSYLGLPASVAFRIINAFSAFGMGSMCAALLIKGAVEAHLKWYFILIYCVFSVIWGGLSYRICPVQDGGMKGFGFFGNVLMGAFAGIFVAAPAFAVMQTAEQPDLTDSGFSYPESGSASLRGYLSCGSVTALQKFVAIFP